MTIDEAIKNREDCLKYLEGIGPKASPDCLEAVRWSVKALKALRPVSREQVWKGEWEWYDEEVGSPLEGIEREWGWRCSKCKVVLPDDFDDPDNPPAMRFCQWCGAPMTDEAVDIVMKRLEALYEDNG